MLEKYIFNVQLSDQIDILFYVSANEDKNVRVEKEIRFAIKVFSSGRIKFLYYQSK